MKNSKALFQDFVSQLTLSDDKDEVRAVAYLVFEFFFGLTRTDILAAKEIQWNAGTQASLAEVAYRLNAHEPVQYVLGEAEFYGRKFYVDAAVLIPRPETEELVRAVLHFYQRYGAADFRVWDIGTGSGCIPVTLKCEAPAMEVVATDVSEKALAVAKGNAAKHGAAVTFMLQNVFADDIAPGVFDVMVSNPPYIPEGEKRSMHDNVLRYEPSLALFVTDGDPLLFYRAIATKALKALKSKGLLIFEIHERYGREVAVLLESIGFDAVEVIQDLSGKDRIVKGILSSLL